MNETEEGIEEKYIELKLHSVNAYVNHHLRVVASNYG